MTGWFDSMLGGKRLESAVEVRLEQEAHWKEARDEPCPQT